MGNFKNDNNKIILVKNILKTLGIPPTLKGHHHIVNYYEEIGKGKNFIELFKDDKEYEQTLKDIRYAMSLVKKNNPKIYASFVGTNEDNKRIGANFFLKRFYNVVYETNKEISNKKEPTN